jgi:hypothetical protein
MDSSTKLDNETLPTNHINYKLLDENVNWNRNKKYFTDESWQFINSLILQKKEQFEWECITCDNTSLDLQSVACGGCLEWQHMKCAGLKSVPKQMYWICRYCTKQSLWYMQYCAISTCK